MFQDSAGRLSPGLVIACSDVLFTFEGTAGMGVEWSHSKGVVGVAVPMPSSYGPHHGVYLAHSDGTGEWLGRECLLATIARCRLSHMIGVQAASRSSSRRPQWPL